MAGEDDLELQIQLILDESPEMASAFAAFLGRMEAQAGAAAGKMGEATAKRFAQTLKKGLAGASKDAGKQQADAAAATNRLLDRISADYFRRRRIAQDAADRAQAQREATNEARRATTQKGNWSKRLEDQRTANKQGLEQQKIDGRIEVLEKDNILKRLRALVYRATYKEIEDRKAANKTALQAQRHDDSLTLVQARKASSQETAEKKAGYAKALQTQRAADRIDYVEQQASQARRTALTKSFLRGLNNLFETGLHSTRDVIRAHYEKRNIVEQGGQDRALATTQRGMQRQAAAVRLGLDSQSASYTKAAERRLLSIQRQTERETKVITEATVKRAAIQARAAETASTGVLGAATAGRFSGGLRAGLLGAGGYLSARAIFGPITDYEQTKIAFEGLLGTKDKAKAFLKVLRDFAAVTPFDQAGVFTSAKQLLAVGFDLESIIPTLTTIGNVVSTLGGGSEAIQSVIRAVGQIRGKGKAAAEELNQISEAVPGFSALKAIAESLGITTAEAGKRMQKGLIPAEVAIQALLTGMRNFKGASGAMDRQSRTLGGRIETLKDTFKNLLIDGTEPLVGPLANLVGYFTDFLTKLFQGSGVWKIVRTGLFGIAAGLLAIVAAKGAVQVLQLTGLAIKGLAANPLLIVAAGLGAVGAILFRFANQGDRITNFFKGLVEGTRNWFIVGYRVKDSIKGLSGIVTIQSSLGATARKVVDFFKQIRDALVASPVGSLAREFVAQFQTVGLAVDSLFSGDFEGAGAFLKHAFGMIGGAASEAGKYLIEGLKAVLRVATVWLLDTGFPAVGNAVTQAGGFIGALFRGDEGGGAGAKVGAKVRGVLSRVIGSVTSVVVAAIGGVATLGSELWQRIQPSLMVMFEAMKEWFITVGGPAILKGLYRLGKWLGDKGVGTLLSEPVLRAVLGVAAALAAAAGSFLLGFIAGLAKSVPRVAESLRHIFADIFKVALDGLKGNAIGTPIVSALATYIDGIFENVGHSVRGISALIEGIFSKGDQRSAAFDRFKQEMVAGLSNTFRVIWKEVVPSVLEGFGAIYDAVGKALSDLPDKVGERWGPLVKVLLAPFEFFAKTMGDILSSASEMVSGIADLLTDLFSGRWTDVLKDVIGLNGIIMDLLGKLLGNLIGFARDLIVGVNEAVVKGLTAIVVGLFNLPDKIADLFLSVPGKILDILKGLPGAIGDLFRKNPGELGNAVTGAIDVARRKHKEVLDAMDAESQKHPSITDRLKNGFDAVRTAISEMIDKYKTWLDIRDGGKTDLAQTRVDLTSQIAESVATGRPLTIDEQAVNIRGARETFGAAYAQIVKDAKGDQALINQKVKEYQLLLQAQVLPSLREQNAQLGDNALTDGELKRATEDWIKTITDFRPTVKEMNIPVQLVLSQQELTGVQTSIRDAIQHGVLAGWFGGVPAKAQQVVPPTRDPDRPGFARGGIVRKKMLAWVGENGPEAVIPLGDRRRANEVLAQAGQRPDLNSLAAPAPRTAYAPGADMTGIGSAVQAASIAAAVSAQPLIAGDLVLNGIPGPSTTAAEVGRALKRAQILGIAPPVDIGSLYARR